MQRQVIAGAPANALLVADTMIQTTLSAPAEDVAARIGDPFLHVEDDGMLRFTEGGLYVVQMYLPSVAGPFPLLSAGQHAAWRSYLELTFRTGVGTT